MSGQLISIQTFIPWISFIAGLSGSLHCLGMCGGLITASCNKNSDIAKYQLGRLSAYLFLGFLGGLFGNLLSRIIHLELNLFSPFFTILPGVFIGSLFLYWGIQNLRGKSSEIPLPQFMGRLYGKMWKKFISPTKQSKISLTQSYIIGSMSVLLPCGLLYGMVISTFVMSSPLIAMLSMFSFWLGTLPAMVIAPHFFQKIISPFKKNNPKIFAISLIIIGLTTVSFRVIHFQAQTTNASNSASLRGEICH